MFTFKKNGTCILAHKFINDLNRILWNEEACNGYCGLQNKNSKLSDTKRDLSKNRETQSENEQNDDVMWI